jgi:DNA invertase Pin-like site-specific DNA recombinase
MSTDHQRYSTENQAAVIAQYAERHGITIVATYADEGRSGLRIEGRGALQRLINDIQQARADFSMILVYDVSRWGRFQDVDESAYYEYLCRRAGVAVQYCAEQFENDGSIASTIVKTVKRAMAGEYSRELSTKVFAGQCRLIEMGFRQGGTPGYGLRRLLIDQHGTSKAELARGEQKSLLTDRVILVPGPDHEVQTVRRIFGLFVKERRSENEIAAILNGNARAAAPLWTLARVRYALTNENYIGNNVFNRVSFKLKRKRVVNPREMWVRALGAFAAIVDLDTFRAAQEIFAERDRRFTDTEMLERLRQLFELRGALSSAIINGAEAMPTASAYRQRFGSLTRAYILVGFTPARDYRFLEINRALRRVHDDVVAEVVAAIERGGGVVLRDPANDALLVNEEFFASVIIARCRQTSAGAMRWSVRLNLGRRSDVAIVARMNLENSRPLDWYLLPRIDISEARIRMAERNGIFLDAYRSETLDAFVRLASREEMRAAA